VDQGLVSEKKPDVIAEPVTDTWGLSALQLSRIQGLVVSGFGHLPVTRALFLRLDQTGGAWLDILKRVAPVTSASEKLNRDSHRATAIAFTRTGLQRLGLDKDTDVQTFSLPFLEGMQQADRRRRLGDEELKDGNNSGTVIKGGPIWSGGEKARPDAIEVHVLLLLYARDETDLAGWADQVERVLEPAGATVVRRLDLSLRLDPDNRAREHFGFADGFSQPKPYVPNSGSQSEKNPWHGVPVGEVLMSYANAHGENAPGPVIQRPAEVSVNYPDLKLEGSPEGFLDLGANGSYLVVRELRQDVAAFWNSLKAAAEKLGNPAIDAEWLANRIVGRERDGDLLCPAGALKEIDGQPANDVGFFHEDFHGLGCPLGSHVRRANPRDGLAATEADRGSLLKAANNHRILRRGRKYGETIANRLEDDGKDRGLLFMCLNTDIVRQFEFIQQTWMLNRNFGTLFGETDPLMGPKGPFTIPKDPLRLRVDVETYVKMVGGDYFFLPSLPALDFMASLR
jgi:Dyp-type peroxidase family